MHISESYNNQKWHIPWYLEQLPHGPRAFSDTRPSRWWWMLLQLIYHISGISNSNSWRRVGGTKSYQVHLWGKYLIHFRKGSWKVQGSEHWLWGLINCLPRTSSHSRAPEGIDKDLTEDWQTLKGRLKHWKDRPELVVFNQPLDSRVFFRGNSKQKLQFQTTPLMK